MRLTSLVPALACLAFASVFAESKSASPYALRGMETPARLSLPTGLPENESRTDSIPHGPPIDRSHAALGMALGGLVMVAGFMLVRVAERKAKNDVDRAVEGVFRP